MLQVEEHHQRRNTRRVRHSVGRLLPGQVLGCRPPGPLRVESRVVPGEIGCTQLHDLARRSLVHRVHDNAGELPAQPSFALVVRAEHYPPGGAVEVVDRVVVPQEDLAPPDLFGLLRVGDGDLPGNHAVAGPHHQHPRVERRPDRRLVRRILHVGVLGRHELQRRHTGVGVDEFALHAVEQLRLRPSGRAFGRPAVLRLITRAVPAGVGNVVQRHGEVAHPRVVHRLQLGRQRAEVGVIAVADRRARREREGELHVVRFGLPDQLLHPGEFVRRIRLTPFLPVVRVVLGRVDVGVQLDIAVEGQLVHAFGVRPGRPVEAFDGAAQRHQRMVHDADPGDAARRGDLPQRLHAVVGTGGIGGSDEQGRGAVTTPGQHVSLGGQRRRRGVVQVLQPFHHRRRYAVADADAQRGVLGARPGISHHHVTGPRLPQHLFGEVAGRLVDHRVDDHFDLAPHGDVITEPFHFPRLRRDLRQSGRGQRRRRRRRCRRLRRSVRATRQHGAQERRDRGRPPGISNEHDSYLDWITTDPQEITRRFRPPPHPKPDPDKEQCGGGFRR